VRQAVIDRGRMAETPKRKKIDNIEKLCLIDVVMKTDGGRLLQALQEGSGNNYKKNAIWVRVATLMSQKLNKPYNNQDVRKLYQRVAAAERKKHDQEANKLRRECAGTGGGEAPNIPLQVDPDKAVELGGALDPTQTPWNTFTGVRTTRSPGAARNPRQPLPTQFLDNNSEDENDAGGYAPLDTLGEVVASLDLPVISHLHATHFPLTMPSLTIRPILPAAVSSSEQDQEELNQLN
jgi:hypothetical protein